MDMSFYIFTHVSSYQGQTHGQPVTLHTHTHKVVICHTLSWHIISMYVVSTAFHILQHKTGPQWLEMALLAYSLRIQKSLLAAEEDY